MINVCNAYKEVLDELLRKGKNSQQTFYVFIIPIRTCLHAFNYSRY